MRSNDEVLALNLGNLHLNIIKQGVQIEQMELQINELTKERDELKAKLENADKPQTTDKSQTDLKLVET